MKPIKMKNWGECMSAAVASVLELPLDDMPKIPMLLDEFQAECDRDGIKIPIKTIQEYYENPKVLQSSEWFNRLNDWLARNRERIMIEVARAWENWLDERGLELLTFPPSTKIPGYSIANCEYKNFTHALVLLDGEICFDPEEGFGPENMEFPWEIRRIHVIQKISRSSNERRNL